MTLIECRDLTRIYHRGDEAITPLDGLDLDIDAGRFVALMGPSGSGKTTLLNLLAGIDRPTRGSLVIDGRPIHELARGPLARWRSAAAMWARGFGLSRPASRRVWANISAKSTKGIRTIAVPIMTL